MLDRELLIQYRSGDIGALNRIFSKYISDLRYYIISMTDNGFDSDDIVQEVFIKAHQFILDGRYSEQSKMKPWLLRIARNIVIDRMRDEQRSRGKFLEIDRRTYEFAIDTSSPETKIVHQEAYNELIEAIKQLPLEQQEVINLRYFEGLPYSDIASQTNVGVNTALGRTRYALINLRKIYLNN